MPHSHATRTCRPNPIGTMVGTQVACRALVSPGWMRMPSSGLKLWSHTAGGTTWASMLNGFAVHEDFNLRHIYNPSTSEPECALLCASLLQCRSYSYAYQHRQCKLKSATCVEAGVGVGCKLVKPGYNALHIHRDKTGEIVLQKTFVGVCCSLHALEYPLLTPALMISRAIGRDGMLKFMHAC